MIAAQLESALTEKRGPLSAAAKRLYDLVKKKAKTGLDAFKWAAHPLAIRQELLARGMVIVNEAGMYVPSGFAFESED